MDNQETRNSAQAAALALGVLLPGSWLVCFSLQSLGKRRVGI